MKLLIILLLPVAGTSQSKTTTVLPTDIYSEYNLYGNRPDVPGKTAPSQIKMYCGATKQAMLMEPFRIRIKCDSIGNSDQPLVIVNGCEMQFSNMKWINPSVVQSVDVFKSTTAIEKFGAKAKFGAIVIILKNNDTNTITKAGIIKPVPKP